MTAAVIALAAVCFALVVLCAVQAKFIIRLARLVVAKTPIEAARAEAIEQGEPTPFRSLLSRWRKDNSQETPPESPDPTEFS